MPKDASFFYDSFDEPWMVFGKDSGGIFTVKIHEPSGSILYDGDNNYSLPGQSYGW